MTILIAQVCNGCGKRRDIAQAVLAGRSTLPSAANAGGWREVGDNKHLCMECIEGTLTT